MESKFRAIIGERRRKQGMKQQQEGAYKAMAVKLHRPHLHTTFGFSLVGATTFAPPHTTSTYVRTPPSHPRVLWTASHPPHPRFRCLHHQYCQGRARKPPLKHARRIAGLSHTASSHNPCDSENHTCDDRNDRRHQNKYVVVI